MRPMQSTDIKLYTLEAPQYLEGTPVMIPEGELLMGRISENLSVRLTLRNISDKTVIAATVRLTLFDAKAKAFPEYIEYKYDGLKAERDDFFGSRVRIPLQDGSVRSFAATVTAVAFDDYTTWRNEEEFSSVAPIQTLSDALGDEDTVKQYAAQYGADCKYMPSSTADIWYCTCGAVNSISDDKCHSCRRKRAALEKVNLETVKTEGKVRAEAEKKAEEAARIEREEKRENNRRIYRIALVILPILLVAALVLATVPSFIRQRDAYAEAQQLLESGRFDEAQAAFEALGNYSDSAQLASTEIPYQKAAFVFGCAETGDDSALPVLGLKKSDVADEPDLGIFLYRRAGEMFAAMGDYKDSASNIVTVNQKIEEYNESLRFEAYNECVSLLEDGKFLKARDAFSAMAGYKDSETMMNECLYRRAQKLLEFIQNNDVRHISIDISADASKATVITMPGNVLTKLGSDAIYSLRQCFSGDGVELIYEDEPSDEKAAPICEAVAAEFIALGDYKDSADAIPVLETCADFTAEFYQLLAAGKLNDAVRWLKTYDDEIPNREMYPEWVEEYNNFCGYWELVRGDSSLIPYSAGTDTTMGAINAYVTIEGDTAILHLDDPYGNYAAELTAELGNTDFSATVDDWSFYYGCINQMDYFVYIRYANADRGGGVLSSCEYSRS